MEGQCRAMDIVTGMHRSGTSLVAAILAKNGYELGENLLPGNKFNPNGYFEDRECTVLNELVLRSLGRCWYDPREPGGDIDSSWQQQLQEYIQSRVRRSRRPAVKDPRICRLFTLWTQALAQTGVTTRVVVCVRHPSEVMNSLDARDSMPARLSLALWWRYLVSAARWLSNGQFPYLLVTYDSLFDKSEGIERLGKFLGLEMCELDSVVDPALRRSTSGPYGLSPRGPAHHEAIELYDNLCAEPVLSRIDQARERLAVVDNWFPEWTTLYERYCRAVGQTSAD